MTRWALVALAVVAPSWACREKAHEPDHDYGLELSRAATEAAVDELAPLLAAARTRAAHASPADEALLAHERFYNGWYFRCAGAFGAASKLRAAGASDAITRLDRACKIDLPLADMAEIAALAEIEVDEAGKDRFACQAARVAFGEDWRALGEAGARDAAADALVARYRKACPRLVARRPGWPLDDLK